LIYKACKLHKQKLTRFAQINKLRQERI
jgi:hypothetical protein